MIRLALLAGVTGVAFWSLRILGALDVELVKNVFGFGGGWVFLVAVLLAVMSLLGALKYRLVLRALSLKPPLFDVMCINFISQAIGQWIPGSLAVTEAFRFGLMSGVGIDAPPGKPTLEPAALKGRIGLSLLVDRMIGLGAMFLTSGAVAIVLLATDDTLIKATGFVWMLAFASLIFGGLLVMAPFLPRIFRLRKSSASARRSAHSPSYKVSNPACRIGPWSRLRNGVRSAQRALEEAAVRPGWIVRPFVLGLGICVMNALTLHFSSRAIGRPLPLSIILIAVPFTFISLLLPMGLAGFGGQQLVAAGAFSLFHVGPEIVVAASLVQNTVVLVVISILGVLGAWAASGRLSRTMKIRPRNA